jgi:hypothetical protein
MIVMLLGMMILIAACTSEPDGEGYVFEIDDRRILVLESLQPEQLEMSWNDLFASGTYNGRAIWLSGVDVNKLVKGQRVQYWIDGAVLESYPEQAKAKKVKVLQ